MKKTIVLFISAFILAYNGFSQQDPAALAVLDAMSKKYQSIPAFTADFSYIMENPEEGIDEKFEGKITVMDDKYKLEMSGQEIINDGIAVWTFLEEDNEVTISEYDDSEEEITLSNIFSIYKEGYKYMLSESLENGQVDVVDLVPEDRDKTFFKIRMEIIKAKNELRSFRIFDKSGSRFLYKINQFSANNSITEKDFKFDESKHPGVEVLDFR